MNGANLHPWPTIANVTGPAIGGMSPSDAASYCSPPAVQGGIASHPPAQLAMRADRCRTQGHSDVAIGRART